MPKWKFWEQPAEPTRPAKPVSDTPAPRTARAGSGLGPPEAPRLPRPSLPMAVDPERRTALRRRRDAMRFDVEQAELANRPDNPWRRRMALLAETMAVVEADQRAVAAEPRLDRPARPATPIAVREVRWQDPALVLLHAAGQDLRFESDQDWAERGFQMARSELSLRAGDPAALVPAGFDPELRPALVAHLDQALFAFATDLRHRAENDVAMPGVVTLSDLATPCPICGDWRSWGGRCTSCATRASRLRDLHTELDRLRGDHAREEEDRATWADRLPIARRRLADAEAALAALDAPS